MIEVVEVVERSRVVDQEIWNVIHHEFGPATWRSTSILVSEFQVAKRVCAYSNFAT